MRANNLTFRCFFIGMTVLVLCSGNLFSQLVEISRNDVHSEGKFYLDLKDSTVYTDAIVINFRDHVIDLKRGKRYASINNIRSTFPQVRSILNQLKTNSGQVSIVKQIPDAEWGNIYRTNKRTGEAVVINDLSQLFTLKFSDPVPLEMTLEQFRQLQEVEYVHEPVSIVYLVTPDDPKYGSQWNLESIRASDAWDITRGSSTIKIGIVDDGVLQDHEDLQAKILGGDVVEDEHGTMVAGVAGAETDNTKGVASLGWETSLYTYGGYISVEDVGFAVEDITQATNDVDVINMSWHTARYAQLEDIPEGCPQPSKWVEGAIYPAVIPHSYPEIEDAISNAIAQGVVCVASAGNGSPNEKYYGVNPDPELCDPVEVPFQQYPAMYPSVIGVSGYGTTWRIADRTI